MSFYVFNAIKKHKLFLGRLYFKLSVVETKGKISSSEIRVTLWSIVFWQRREVTGNETKDTWSVLSLFLSHKGRIFNFTFTIWSATKSAVECLCGVLYVCFLWLLRLSSFWFCVYVLSIYFSDWSIVFKPLNYRPYYLYNRQHTGVGVFPRIYFRISCHH